MPIQFVAESRPTGPKHIGRRRVFETKQRWLSVCFRRAEVGPNLERTGDLVAKPQHRVVCLENERRARRDQMLQFGGFPARTHSQSGVADRGGPPGFAFRSRLAAGIDEVAAEELYARVDPIAQGAGGTRLAHAFEGEDAD